MTQAMICIEAYGEDTVRAVTFSNGHKASHFGSDLFSDTAAVQLSTRVAEGHQ